MDSEGSTGKRRTPGRGETAKKQAKRLLQQENRRKALELRKAGATYAAIAKAIGWADASTARKNVQSAIEEVIQEPAQELLKLQIERINHMMVPLWPQAQAGNTDATRTMLQLMEKLDRYHRLDSVQVDVNVNHEGAVLVVEGNQDDYIAYMKRMIGSVEEPRQIEAVPYQPADVEDEIVEAEVVEVEPVVTPKPASPEYDWSVEPAVK